MIDGDYRACVGTSRLIWTERVFLFFREPAYIDESCGFSKMVRNPENAPTRYDEMM